MKTVQVRFDISDEDFKKLLLAAVHSGHKGNISPFFCDIVKANSSETLAALATVQPSKRTQS